MNRADSHLRLFAGPGQHRWYPESRWLLLYPDGRIRVVFFDPPDAPDAPDPSYAYHVFRQEDFR